LPASEIAAGNSALGGWVAPHNEQTILGDRPTMDELQRRYLQLILDENQGKKRRAAMVLGLDRRTVQRLIARISFVLSLTRRLRKTKTWMLRSHRVRRRKFVMGARFPVSRIPHMKQVLLLLVAVFALAADLTRAQATPVEARISSVNGSALLLDARQLPVRPSAETCCSRARKSIREAVATLRLSLATEVWL